MSKQTSTVAPPFRLALALTLFLGVAFAAAVALEVASPASAEREPVDTEDHRGGVDESHQP